MKPLSQSEARVFLVYSNKLEAQAIFSAASMLGMTSKNHMWIVTQSVLGKGAGAAPGEFPSGMLGQFLSCFEFALLKLAHILLFRRSFQHHRREDARRARTWCDSLWACS